MDSNHWKKVVLNHTPNRIHPLLEGGYRTVFPKKSEETNRNPSVQETIDKKYIKDTKLLVDVEELFEKLPKNGIIAELGVDQGNTSQKILSISDPAKLYLIDIWESERYDESKMTTVKERFSELRASGRVEIIRKKSDVALKTFDEDYFGWIYIDTTHRYEQTKKELEIGRNKVKPDGVIAGHDYCVGNPSKGISYGVIEAVHEFCETYDWKLSYLTMETTGYSSFALEKL